MLEIEFTSDRPTDLESSTHSEFTSDSWVKAINSFLDNERNYVSVLDRMLVSLLPDVYCPTNGSQAVRYLLVHCLGVGV